MAESEVRVWGGQDGDETSACGSSSSEESMLPDDAGDESTSVGTGKEVPSQATDGRGSNDLKTRLSAFLPAMQKANADLESGDAEVGRLDDLDEDEEQYIEMNLGLGVLEQKERKDGEEVRYAESSSDESGNADEHEQRGAQDEIQEAQKEENVLSELMGKKTTTRNRTRAKRKIQEVD